MDLDVALDPAACRVLGVLAEKQLGTPDYYPMSVNALANGCNQKTNREPVTDYSEAEVQDALDRLKKQGLAGTAAGAGSRVVKYRHALAEAFELGRAEVAVLSALLVRGPQTPGELRQRTSRLFAFEDLDAVQATLDALAARETPLAAVLPRRPGRQQDRWMHTLAGPPDAELELPAPPPAGGAERVDVLEAEVRALRAELDALRDAFDSFRQAFE